MKMRRVTMDLETENDIPINYLRKIKTITIWDGRAGVNKSVKVIQATVNVIKPEKC